METGKLPLSAESAGLVAGSYAGLPQASALPAQGGHTERHIVVVIPAYNEELVIGSVVLRARRNADTVIVVDDGSKDNTAEIARLAGADVVVMPQNGGKAAALMAGFERAREYSAEAVVMIDADGQHNPEEIMTVATPVLAGEADLVIGSRFIGEKADIPVYRRFGQEVLTLCTNASSTCRTTDSQSGFRALSRRAMANLDFASEGYSVESDMIAHFASRGLVIEEVPISVRYDVPHKHKKNPVSHGLGVLGNIISLIGYRRPMLTFGVPGFLAMVLGAFLGWHAFHAYYVTNKFPYELSILTAFLMFSGMLLCAVALILNELVLIVKAQKAGQKI
ncbi:glycosyltransferase family 2 protein [Methanofollis fontis]|uniref:glycosyltransferase family 2 protein n=1 Tax=Methanofollis fontis TaxID=2052832 RepID=UPI001A928BB4|nr:glycosyltransferase family 2 protein [Methanofollis fontis]